MTNGESLRIGPYLIYPSPDGEYILEHEVEGYITVHPWTFVNLLDRFFETQLNITKH